MKQVSHFPAPGTVCSSVNTIRGIGDQPTYMVVTTKDGVTESVQHFDDRDAAVKLMRSHNFGEREGS